MPAAKRQGSSDGGKKAGRTLKKVGPPKRRERARHTETIKFLTLDETKKPLSRIKDKQDRAIFLTAYRHCLRADEVRLLRTDDLDLKRLKFMLHRIKGSLSVEHPLQPDEAHALKLWLKSKGTDLPILFPSSEESADQLADARRANEAIRRGNEYPKGEAPLPRA